MVLRESVTLPTEEELTVSDVNLSISALRAGAFHLGKHCESENNEFMLCKQELKDPRQCIAEGKIVTQCALDFFRKVKKTCYDEFTQYASCLNNSSADMRFSACRNTQTVYDKCVTDNLEITRPEYGYFCRIKVHHTDRPKPKEEPTVYSDVPVEMISGEDNPPANYGPRFII